MALANCQKYVNLTKKPKRNSFKVSCGGEGEIRTRARCYTPNPLAGDPLGPLGYFSIYLLTEVSLSKKINSVNVLKVKICYLFLQISFLFSCKYIKSLFYLLNI